MIEGESARHFVALGDEGVLTERGGGTPSLEAARGRRKINVRQMLRNRFWEWGLDAGPCMAPVGDRVGRWRRICLSTRTCALTLVFGEESGALFPQRGESKIL